MKNKNKNMGNAGCACIGTTDYVSKEIAVGKGIFSFKKIVNKK